MEDTRETFGANFSCYGRCGGCKFCGPARWCPALHDHKKYEVCLSASRFSAACFAFVFFRLVVRAGYSTTVVPLHIFVCFWLVE